MTFFSIVGKIYLHRAHAELHTRNGSVFDDVSPFKSTLREDQEVRCRISTFNGRRVL